MFCGNCRHGCRAQCRQDRHFGQQHRIAIANISQHTKSSDSLTTFLGVFRMAVHVFEAIKRTVTRWHQLNDPFVRMRGNAWRLVELLPTAEIFLDHRSKFLEEGFDPHRKHKLHHVIDTDEGNNVQLFIGHDSNPLSDEFALNFRHASTKTLPQSSKRSAAALQRRKARVRAPASDGTHDPKGRY